jgi:AraC family transcriptional regulator, regulatory protein of adaptative response / methylated-DNA-[protein]-cysteine methyltransferase
MAIGSRHRGSGNETTSLSMHRSTVRSADAAWQALSMRDRRFDGRFVYAVSSTGLYCRPSCPARHPLRRNTMLYGTAQEAERHGFQACSRCSPGTSAETLAESCVKAVIHYIDAHPSQRITLKALSRTTGLSPNYVHEAFRRIVGLTPKTYHDIRRIELFKAHLRQGDSIAGASYSAGYGSSRALYVSARRVMGMTPSVFRRGAGIQIRFAVIKSPLGLVLVAGTQMGLCAVLEGANRNQLYHDLRQNFPNAVFIHESPAPAGWTAVVRSSGIEDPFVSRLSNVVRVRILRAKVLLAQH